MGRWTGRNKDAPEQESTSEPVVPARMKITGAQLQERFEAKAAARAAAKAEAEPSGWPGRGRQVTLGTLSVLALACGLAMGNSASSTSSDQQAQIATLSQRVDELRTKAAPASGDTKAAHDRLVAARRDIDTAASKVARVQTNYSVVVAARAKKLSKGASSDADVSLQPLVDQRKALAAHFADSTFLVDDKVAYAAKVGPDFEGDLELTAGKVDPRYPWLVPVVGIADANASTCTWQVLVATPDTSGDLTSTGSAVWVCRTKGGTASGPTGGVAAWAYADFDHQEKVFTNLQVITTSLRADLDDPVAHPLKNDKSSTSKGGKK